MHSTGTIARALAAALLAGDWQTAALAQRGARLLGREWRWLRPLARTVMIRFAQGPRPRHRTLTDFLLTNRTFLHACARHQLLLVERISGPPPMSPVEAAKSWNLPAIRTPGELADWLEIPLAELDWLADRRGLEAKNYRKQRRNYHYRPLAKRFGAIRLIESPKPRLKAVQRRILAEILNRVPPHAAAHGFCRGRSIRSFAQPHVGQAVVLRIDLEDFFPSIRAARIQALFRTIGYAEAVADLLAGLCTNAAPLDVWDNVSSDGANWNNIQMQRDRARPADAAWLYRQPHLPQGAPCSPALANLCAYRLDCRLDALAVAAGAAYTRYADDLAFSGDHGFARIAHRFQLHVCATALEEGFQVHHRKTRIMRRGARQRLAGIVVNRRLNAVRGDYDRLKATLTNVLRHGPPSQNRENHPDFRAHLLGRISFIEMLHPGRGRRLRVLFDPGLLKVWECRVWPREGRLGRRAGGGF